MITKTNVSNAKKQARKALLREQVMGSGESEIRLPHFSSDEYAIKRLATKAILKGIVSDEEVNDLVKKTKLNTKAKRALPSTFPKLPPQRITSFMSYYTREYIKKHGELPYYLDTMTLDQFKGCDIADQAQGFLDVNIYKNDDPELTINSMYLTGVNDLQFIPNMLSNPENIYIDDDPTCGNIAQTSGGTAYDNWRIFNNYQENYDYFYDRRNSIGGSTNPTSAHNPIYEYLLIFCFCNGQFLRTNVSSFSAVVHKNIARLYALMITDTWDILTRGRTATDTYIDLSVGNMFKLLVGITASFSCDEYSRLLVINGQGADDSKCVIGTSMSLQYTTMDLYAPSTINERNAKCRKISNCCYKFALPFNRFVTLLGQRYGVISASGDRLEYWLEVDSNDLALGYVQADLDFSDAEVAGNGVLQKTFHFNSPVKLQYLGLTVVNFHGMDCTVEDNSFTLEQAYHGAMDSTFRPLIDVDEWKLFNNGTWGTVDSSSSSAWFESSASLLQYETGGPRSHPWAGANNNAVRNMRYDGTNGNIDNGTINETWSQGGSSSYTENRPCMRARNWYTSSGDNPTIPYRALLPLNMQYDAIARVRSASVKLHYQCQNVDTQQNLEISKVTETQNAFSFIRFIYLPNGESTRQWSISDWAAHELDYMGSLSKSTYGPYISEYQPKTLGDMNLWLRESVIKTAFANFGPGQICLCYYATNPSAWSAARFHKFAGWNIHWELEDELGTEFVPYSQNMVDCWTPKLQRFIGSYSKPIGKFAMPFVYTKSTALINYLDIQYGTKLKDVVSNAILKRLFATTVDQTKLAQLIRFMQDPSQGGLEVDTEILRNLIVDAQEIRTVRTLNVLSSIQEMLDMSDLRDAVTQSISSTFAITRDGFEEASTQLKEHYGTARINVSQNMRDLFDAAGLEIDDYIDQGSIACSDVVTALKAAEEYVSTNTTETNHNVSVLCEAVRADLAASTSDVALWLKRLGHVPSVDWSFDSNTPIFDIASLRAHYLNSYETLKMTVDTDFLRDNPSLAEYISWNAESKCYELQIKEWWEGVAVSDLIPDLDGLSFESEEVAQLYDNGSFMDIIAHYNAICDTQAELVANGYTEEAEALKAQAADCASLIKCVRGQLIDEYAQLASSVLNYKFEDALDDIADDDNTMSSDGAFSTISTHIDAVQNSLQQSIDLTDVVAGSDGKVDALGAEAKKIKELVAQKFSALANQTSVMAKNYYSSLIAKLGEAKEGIQIISDMLSFSVQNMIEKVRANVADAQTFLQQMVGVSPTDASSYGWQSSTMFTPRSNVSIAMGCVATGVVGAIGAVFSLIGKVITGAATKVRSAIMSITEDGVSFRRRSKGYNTLSLQACTTTVTEKYFKTLYPDLHDKLWDPIHPESGILRGNNSTYAAAQLGPILLFIQDYRDIWDDLQCMITLNPVILDEDNTLAEGSDYTFAVKMAESIQYARRFMNKFFEKASQMGLITGYYPVYEIPSTDELLKDIYAKAEGTSSAEAWGWRAVILGIGVAAGVILCCTGYGSAAGIALIAGVTIAAECMTAGTAVDQSKIEHLENDQAYANATIKSSDLASIWTDCVPASAIRLILGITDKMTNLKYHPSDPQLPDVYLDLVHDGRGDVLDINEILGTSSDDYPAELGYVPMIQGVKYPNFRYSLVTDMARAAYATAGLVALSIPCFILVKNATVATVNKIAAKAAAKKAAQQWAVPQPDAKEYTREERVVDGNGNPIQNPDGSYKTRVIVDEKKKKAMNKAYIKTQTKLAYKADRLSNICIGGDGGSSDSTGSSIIAGIKDQILPANETQVEANIKALLDRVG